MCEHAPPEPLCLQSTAALRAALDDPRLCDRCRMAITSELLMRKDCLDDEA
jgi:hypothetical protein